MHGVSSLEPGILSESPISPSAAPLTLKLGRELGVENLQQMKGNGHRLPGHTVRSKRFGWPSLADRARKPALVD